MKEKMLNYFKNILLETEKLSSCANKSVAAILIKNDRIVATSYNGVPSGGQHCNEHFNVNNYKFINQETFKKDHYEWSLENEIHSEINLIAFCAKEGISMKDNTIIMSWSPCINCAKALVVSGVKEILYMNEYKDSTGKNFLKNYGIDINKI